MKKIGLFAVLFTFLALSLSNLPAVSNTPKETRVTGTLHFGKSDTFGIESNETGNSIVSYPKGYWLKSDQPLYVHQGSKSEASTNVVKLHVPVNLQEKAKKLYGKHVVVVGSMDCTSSGWGPGHASCDMLVTQIDLAE